MHEAHPLHHFIPYRISDQGELLCRWMHTGDKRFTEPFFEETISRCRFTGINSHSYISSSTIAGMIAGAQEIKSVAPSAFVFHVSRCGSTLLSQLLSIDEEHIVLSEVPLLDEIMRVHRKKLEQQEHDDALRAAIKLMGQVRTGREKHLFVKLDSWHIVYWKKLRELYPSVPFIMLYRSPAEVARSHRKHRGLQMVPGMLDPALLDLDPQEAQSTRFDEYTAKVLDRFYRGMLDALVNDARSLAVNYDEGIMQMIRAIALHTGVAFSPAALQAMEQRSSFHSKRSGESFREHEEELPSGSWLGCAMDSYEQLMRQAGSSRPQ